MFTPKVKFKIIPLVSDVKLIHSFLFRNKYDWSKRIIKKYPAFKKIYSLGTEKEQLNFLKSYINSFREKNKKTINKNKIRYRKKWRRIEKDYFKILAEILEINWPKNRKTIIALISINPICPRFLNSWGFSLFYNCTDIDKAIEVIMHECCHFLYFEKWKKMYPKMNAKKFESPHIEWHLSEITAPIILNDKKVQKYLRQKASFYKKHSAVKIKNKTAPRFFTDIYNRNINKENGFELFLKEAYKEIKKTKKLFLSL